MKNNIEQLQVFDAKSPLVVLVTRLYEELHMINPCKDGRSYVDLSIRMNGAKGPYCEEPKIKFGAYYGQDYDFDAAGPSELKEVIKEFTLTEEIKRAREVKRLKERLRLLEAT